MVTEIPLSQPHEYIEGLLQHDPAAIDTIYQRFANKALRFILQKSGQEKDAAHIFEEALMDIYYFASNHPLGISSSFEPFLMLLCKRIWEKELERRGQRIAGLEADETAALGREDLQDVEDIVKEGEKRRWAYHYYLQLDDSCRSLMKLSLAGCLHQDISTATGIPATDVPAQRAICYSRMLRAMGNNAPLNTLSERDFETADLYLNKQLSPEEIRDVDEKQKNNPAWRDMIRKFYLVRRYLTQRICPDENRDKLQHLLFAHRNAWLNHRDHTSAPIRKLVIVIAIFAAGIASLLFFSPWRKNVYRQFASTEMEHNTPDDTALLHEAAIFFNHGDFRETITLLDSVLKTNPGNQYARYYRGVSLVDLNRQRHARADLEPVYNSNSPYRYEAAFYIALSYLQEGNRQQCLEWLLKIPEDAPNALKVQKLIEELK